MMRALAGAALAAAAAAAPRAPAAAQWLALTAKVEAASAATLAYIAENGTVVGAVGYISMPNEAVTTGTLRCGGGACFFTTLNMASPGAAVYNVSAASGTVSGHAAFGGVVAPVLEYDAAADTVYTVLSGGGNAEVVAVNAAGGASHVVNLTLGAGLAVADGGSAMCPGSATLYVLLESTSRKQPAQLVTVNVATGAPSVVSLAQGAPAALAVNCSGGGGSGVLFGVYADENTGQLAIAAIDPGTGDTTVVATAQGGAAGTDLDSLLAFAPAGGSGGGGGGSLLASLLPSRGNDVTLWAVTAGDGSGGGGASSAQYKAAYYLAGAVSAAAAA
jgi:hypothetical protein